MKKIITISREFGSGGRELGKRLADALGYDYYDREIITHIAETMGYSEEYVSSLSEQTIDHYAINFGRTFYINPDQNKVLSVQHDFLKRVAEKGNCVIVGRGANIILKDYNPLDIFVYADMESKVQRCISKADNSEHFSEKEIIKKIKQIDKNRRNYYSIFSEYEWGDKRNYHLCINTTNVEIKKLIPALKALVENIDE